MNKSEIELPSFCTIVGVDEYDYIGQCNEAVNSANKFHGTININENCPPPYYPLDVGKFVGLVKEVQSLRAQLAEARRVIEPFANEAEHWHEMYKNDYRPLCDSSEGGAEAYAYFLVGDLRAAAKWLKENPAT